MLLLDPSAHPLIAHRGDRAHAPENTLLAFSMARDAGADAIELDVRLTSDGKVVVCHDPTVDRTTSGRGTIAKLPLAAIREFDAGKGQRIPLLEEVLEACTLPILVELKTLAVTEPTLAVLERAGARNRVLIGSFVDAAHTAPRRAGFYTTASRRELRRLLPRALVRADPAPQPFNAISMPPTRFGAPLPIAGFVRASGVPVHIWTVNDVALAASFRRRGVCGIVTDDPAKMRRSA